MMSDTNYENYSNTFERDLKNTLSNNHTSNDATDDDNILEFPNPSAATGSNSIPTTISPSGANRQPISGSPPGGYGMQSGYGGMCAPAANIPANLTPNKIDMDKLKQWSISTYKCTRQAISEKLGKEVKRTVDVELEHGIDECRDLQRRYQSILRLSRALESHFYHVIQTQQALGEEFAQLALKEKELADELKFNSETQSSLVKNGERLLASLNFFVSSVNTLCNKTIDDTLLTIKTFESARLEYDAYRGDLEALQQSASRGGDFQVRLQEAQTTCDMHKEKYEQLRQDVQVKLKFLSDNKVKVLQKQLLLFHNATSAYFSGNAKGLEDTMAQFNIKPKVPNSQSLSWLEQP